MHDYESIIQESIFRDMSEGVMTIGFDGIIRFLNPAAQTILERSAAELTNKPFAACFFEKEENDAFNQAIVDTIYTKEITQNRIVSYLGKSHSAHLRISASYLHFEDNPIGVIIVFSDISEMIELQDAVKAMERIQQLNTQLKLRNKLISETFGRFLSDEIVQQLLDTPDGLALGGKKRMLTILMSDLRGFTAMSERMPAQELLSMLNHYLGEMTLIIQARGGTIIEFIGDGILAIFGAPAPSHTHAADAVACAVEMQARMATINSWNEEQGYPVLEMGIGVNTGEVIVGNIGSEKRTKYGVVGQHVNLCGRIESYTVGGQILLSPRTRALISSPLEIVSELEVYPKGVKEPILISQVTGIGEPYHVSFQQVEERLIPLTVPISSPFYIIHEKHCDDHSTQGRLTALSQRATILETSFPLKSYQNLKLETPVGEVFAKVLYPSTEGEGQWFLHFTTLSEGAREGLKKILNTQK